MIDQRAMCIKPPGAWCHQVVPPFGVRPENAAERSHRLHQSLQVPLTLARPLLAAEGGRPRS